MIKESYIIPIFVVVQVIIGNAQFAYNPYHMDFQVDQGHVYHHYQPKTIVDPKNPQCKITCRPFFAKLQPTKPQDLAFIHLTKPHAVDCLQDVDHVLKPVVSKITRKK